MNDQPDRPATALLLGIEGGGTRTVAILADERGQQIRRLEAGPANLKLLSDTRLLVHFRALARQIPSPDALGVGMAGARSADDHERIRRAVARVWPNRPCAVSHDLASALAAAESASDPESMTRVIVLSGTGSCCYGQGPNGQTAKVGGWGHLIGDKGSGYEIGLRALKAVVYYFDRDGVWSALGERLLRRLQLNEPNDLIDWAQKADKREIAVLAVEVFEAWAAADRIAADILRGAAHSLSADGVACARKLARSGSPVQFILAGGVLLQQPRFARLVARRVRELWPKARVTPLRVESAWGAVAMARLALISNRNSSAADGPASVKSRLPVRPSPRPVRAVANPFDELFRPESFRGSPTERRNPRSLRLHTMSVERAIRLMLTEERRGLKALFGESRKIGRVIGWITHAFRNDGRLFYVGAGTSGRLGVLDASECPPTFGTRPEQVQGIIAGGAPALWSSVEGAEDDPAAGAAALRFRKVNPRDIVVGIAASGRTPFVWGALAEAQRRGARTILIGFNPGLKAPRALRPDLMISPDLGPEVLTGSTRLKAGTATKLILNLLTTLTMVRLGKVVSNLMVDLNPSNTKLRDRAVRIVRELTGADESAARQALEKTKWVVQNAWRALIQ